MSEEIKNPRPSDPDVSISVHSSYNKVTITIPCFLHGNDEERIYDVLYEFLKTCKRTEEFLDEMAQEAQEREEYFKNNPELRKP